MNPFPSNRKNPFSRMCIRACYLRGEVDGLSVEDIASISGSTKAHVYNVIKPIKGIDGASPAQVADAVYKLYSDELGAEVGRELWNPWWVSAQEMAADSVALFNKAMQEIERSADLLIDYAGRGRKAVREVFEAAHATVADGEQAEAVR